MHRFLRGGAIVLIAVCGAACSSSPRPDADHPLTRMRNPGLSINSRIDALEEAWKLGEPGTPDRIMTRDAMKDLVWSSATPHELRIRIMGKLLDATDPAEAKDAREMAKLMLPRERSRAMVLLLSDVAGNRDWTDFIPALVRSYSRPVELVKDELRSERVALDKLAHGAPVEQLVFDVFVNPPPAEETYGVNWQERMRTDAWDLLGRLDADGTRRVKLVSDLEAKGIPANDAVLSCLKQCFHDLRAIPLTGDELKWALSLRNPKSTENAAWWTEATTAIASTNFETTGPMSLRYAEPIRWVSKNHSEWLSQSRAELKGELGKRLSQRARNTRTNDLPVSGPYQETLEQWDSKLRWGDFLTILVLDEALKESTLPAQMMRHAELDRRDTTTEYGGILRVADVSEAPAVFAAVLYPPRPGQRTGDQAFIASDDMVAGSDRVLAHYHFHANSVNNRVFSGPSLADLQYAKKMGRSCLVFTSLKEGVLGIDYYQPNGAVIDLGEMHGTVNDSRNKSGTSK